MLYCDRCQVLSRDEQICPVCGSRNLRIPKGNDPVHLFTADTMEAERITAAFNDEGIPHMEKSEGASALTVILGQSHCMQTRIFVPFCEVGHAEDVMRGICALSDESNENSEQPEKEAASDEHNEPMNDRRHVLLRIFYTIMFLILVASFVFFADGIVSEFKSFFH